MISSTPDEHDFDSTASGGSHDMDHTPLNRMAPPIHPPLRHSSTDTSTTSSETSSSSSCLMTKVKSVVRIEGTSDEDTHRGTYIVNRVYSYMYLVWMTSVRVKIY